MDEIMTVAEIEGRFQSEWVLVDDPETSADLELQRGTVLFHSKNRDEVYRTAVQLRPARFAILFTGTPPKNTAIAV